MASKRQAVVCSPAVVFFRFCNSKIFVSKHNDDLKTFSTILKFVQKVSAGLCRLEFTQPGIFGRLIKGTRLGMNWCTYDYKNLRFRNFYLPVTVATALSITSTKCTRSDTSLFFFLNLILVLIPFKRIPLDKFQHKLYSNSHVNRQLKTIYWVRFRVEREKKW